MNSSYAHVCILIEFIRGDVIDGKDELDVVLLGFLDKPRDLFRTVFVEEGLANLWSIREYKKRRSKVKEHTETFSSVFLNVKAIPPQIIKELT